MTGAPTWMRQLGRDSAYTLTSLPLAVAAVVLVTTLVAAGLGLLGDPGRAADPCARHRHARGFAYLERRRLGRLAATAMVHPVYLTAEPTDGVVRRLLTPARDRQSWLDVVWVVVAHAHLDDLVVDRRRLVEHGAGRDDVRHLGAVRPARYRPRHAGLAPRLRHQRDRRHPGDQCDRRGRAADLAARPARGRPAPLDAGRDLLCGRAELQQEVRRSEAGRAAGRAAEAESLRRLERDIHDGPQQRLVRLSMDLGRARSQLDQDPERARATIDGALTQARDTVEELRSLSRGIAPPVLVDRGWRPPCARRSPARSCPTTLTYDAPAASPRTSRTRRTSSSPSA